MGQSAYLEESFRGNFVQRWPQAEAVDIPAGSVSLLFLSSLPPSLLLILFHLPSQVINCLNSPLDPQRQNPLLLTPLLLLLISLSIPRKTCRGFLRQFWRLKLPLPLLLPLPLPFLFPFPLLLPLPLPPWLPLSPKRSRRNWRPVSQTYIAGSLTWTAITSISNMKTILLPLEL